MAFQNKNQMMKWAMLCAALFSARSVPIWMECKQAWKHKIVICMIQINSKVLQVVDPTIPLYIHVYFLSLLCIQFIQQPSTNSLIYPDCNIVVKAIDGTGFELMSLNVHVVCVLILLLSFFQFLLIRNNTSTWTFTYTRNYL
jgi:hypothetical protein